MAVHDAWLRITPGELAFPDPQAADRRFQAIADEARARGVVDTDPGAFVLLGEAGRTLREMRGPGEEAGRIAEHGALLYHLYHSWKVGWPTYLLDTRVARFLAESDSWSGPPPRPAQEAAYVQLPQHLVWVRGDEHDRPESVDGLFWTVGRERIAFLVVAGIRADRPGFSVIPVEPAPLERAPGWLGTAMREVGADFSSTLPGAELERLYELRAAGEVLKLGARVLSYLETAAEAARHPYGGAGSAAAPEVPAGSAHRRSSRAFVRVTLAT